MTSWLTVQQLLILSISVTSSKHMNLLTTPRLPVSEVCELTPKDKAMSTSIWRLTAKLIQYICVMFSMCQETVTTYSRLDVGYPTAVTSLATISLWSQRQANWSQMELWLPTTWLNFVSDMRKMDITSTLLTIPPALPCHKPKAGKPGTAISAISATQDSANSLTKS